MIITEEDCGTLNGIEVAAIKQGQEELLPLKDRIFGRTVCDDIYQPGDSTKILAQQAIFLLSYKLKPSTMPVLKAFASALLLLVNRDAASAPNAMVSTLLMDVLLVMGKRSVLSRLSRSGNLERSSR